MLLIADEPTTALDVTVQGKILELLREFQADTDVAILYITHDLGVVSEMCEEVAVMYAGEVVERGHALDVFTNPRHPYTEGLIAALPQRAGVARRFRSIEGTVPSPEHMPAGCRFHPRCSHAQAGVCTERQLEMVRVETSSTRCARHAELELKGVVG